MHHFRFHVRCCLSFSNVYSQTARVHEEEHQVMAEGTNEGERSQRGSGRFQSSEDGAQRYMDARGVVQAATTPPSCVHCGTPGCAAMFLHMKDSVSDFSYLSDTIIHVIHTVPASVTTRKHRPCWFRAVRLCVRPGAQCTCLNATTTCKVVMLECT